MKNLKRLLAVQAALAGHLALTGGAALAEGGAGNAQPPFPSGTSTQQYSSGTAAYSPGAGGAYSSSTEAVQVQSANLSYSGTLTASAAAVNSNGGRSAGVGNGGYGAATGNGTLSVTNFDIGESFGKGGNSLSIGESVQFVTIVMNGHTYVVAEEVAAAFARATQFGGSTAAYSGAVAADGGGYSSNIVSTSKSGGR